MSVCCDVVCCEVEVSVSDWSLVQRSQNECGVSKCDREASIMRRTWSTGGCRAMGRNYRTGFVCCEADCFNLSSVSLREYLNALLRVCERLWIHQQFKNLCGNAANVRQQWGELDLAS
jgi:hypothetical protein